MGSTVCFCSFCTQHEIGESSSPSENTFPHSNQTEMHFLNSLSPFQLVVLALAAIAAAEPEAEAKADPLPSLRRLRSWPLRLWPRPPWSWVQDLRLLPRLPRSWRQVLLWKEGG